MRVCVGCRATVNTGDGHIDCARCKQSYHSLCVNISDKELQKMTAKNKKDWLCPDCVCKIPRGDNSNTPIRASSSTTSTSSNVTTRRNLKESQPGDDDVHNDSVSRSEIRVIINEIMKECTRSITRRLDQIQSDINSFKESLGFYNEYFEKLKSDIETQTTEVRQLKEDNTKLRVEVNTLTTRLTQLDQISRSANLELQCVPEHKNENVVKIVQQLGRAISCPIDEKDISHCTRVAKINQQSSRPRTILIRLSTPRLRDKLLAASMEYNKKNPGNKLNTSHLGICDDKKPAVYLVENLSPENKALHAAARARARELSYKFVWVRAGRVFMRKTDTSEFVCVRNMEMLQGLV